MLKRIAVAAVFVLTLTACGDEAPTANTVPSWARVAPEQIAEAKKHGVPVAFENDLGMRFVLIPAGTFSMGSPGNEEDRESGEDPLREVTLSPFYMATTETTQAAWISMVAENSFAEQGASFPATNVSWDDSQRFVKRLNETVSGGGYRLPTEAEWEYACRAGTYTRFSSGDSASDLGEVGWCAENSDDRLHRVGRKSANGWGLRDMHGNVAEWCQDVWHDSYEGAHADGSARVDKVANARVFRGGSWQDNDWYLRSAARDGNPPDFNFSRIGFRVVRAITSH